MKRVDNRLQLASDSWSTSVRSIFSWQGWLLGFLFIAFLGQGCAMNPVSGRPEVVLISKKGESEIGKEQAKQVAETMGLTEDPKLTAYIQAIGQQLAMHSPRQDVEYEFHVVEMVEPNAFALPGGYVYVSRGLLPLVNSEDELAGVIGHEIGHVAARHSVQRISKAAPFAIVGGITGGAVGLVNKNLGQAVGGISYGIGSVVLAPYSRGQETEADEVGIEMAASAGWDPNAMPSFLHTLQREVELLQGETREPSFLDSHPATAERVEDTKEHAKELTRAPARPVAKGQAAFLAKLDGLIVGNDPAAGVFIENRFLQPDLDFTLEFPVDWETHNQHQFVAAIEPDGKVLTILQVAGEGDDPLGPPRALGEKLEVNLMEKVKRFNVGRLPAARLGLQMKGEDGPMAVDLTWIAYQGVIYQIMGLSPLPQYEQRQRVFTKIVQSFRPLTSAERESIQVTRLRIANARDGETLQQLLARTGSASTPEETAVANGLETDTKLRDGQLIKVAVPEKYFSAQ